MEWVLSAEDSGTFVSVLSAFSKPIRPLLSPFCPEATAVHSLLGFEHVDKPHVDKLHRPLAGWKWGGPSFLLPIVGSVQNVCCSQFCCEFVCFKQYITASTRLPENTCHWQQACVMLQKCSWHLRCLKTQFWAPPVLAFKKRSDLKTATSPYLDRDIGSAVCGQRQSYKPFFQMAWKGSGEDTWACSEACWSQWGPFSPFQ